jgi:hypothetical protein
VFAAEGAFSSVEWRFAGSAAVEVANNVGTDPFYERDGATAAQNEANLADADAALFADPEGADLHLASGATAAIDQGVVLEPGLCDDDIDGDLRDATPDIGADEVVP